MYKFHRENKALCGLYAASRQLIISISGIVCSGNFGGGSRFISYDPESYVIFMFAQRVAASSVAYPAG